MTDTDGASFGLIKTNPAAGAEPAGEEDRAVYKAIADNYFISSPSETLVKSVIRTARAVAEGCVDLGEDFKVPSHLMAPLSLALDEYDAPPAASERDAEDKYASMRAQNAHPAATSEWNRGWNACLDALDAQREQSEKRNKEHGA